MSNFQHASVGCRGQPARFRWFYSIGSYSLSIDEVQVTILCERVGNRISECWIRGPDGGRQKTRLQHLIAPERRADLEAAAALYVDAANKHREAGEFLHRIPRLDAKDVLARAKDREGVHGPAGA
jgi:hypothetical protein